MNKIETIVADHICLQFATEVKMSPMKTAMFLLMESKSGEQFMRDNVEMYEAMFNMSGTPDVAAIATEDRKLRDKIKSNEKGFNKLLKEVRSFVQSGKIEKYLEEIK